MKNIIVLLIALIAAGACLNVPGQVPPPGASDKSLEDRNIKSRSIELERIKRDANKPDPGNQRQPDKMLAAKFQDIKEDFEQIQLSQSEIITAYTKGKEIDFGKVSAKAEQINKRGVRLKENLFPSVSENQNDKKTKNGKSNVELLPLPQDVKTLIVEMDNTLAAFTANPIFTNPQVVNPDNNVKAKSDLEKLIRLSGALKQKAEKASRQKD